MLIFSSSYFWLIFWFILNIVITLMNKAVFKIWKFPFPITMSLVHMFFTSFFSTLYLEYNDTGTTPKIERRIYWKIFLFSILYCLNILFGNYSLFLVEVSLVQITRSTIPGITMILSYFLLNKRYSFYYVQGILLVVLGVALASYGGTNVSLLGLSITFTVCFLSSFKSVTSSILLDQKIEPIRFSQIMSILSFIQMLIFSYLTGEMDKILSDRKYHTMPYLIILSLNGSLAFLLNLSNFSFIKKNSALTLSVAGNMKHITTILLSFIIFETSISSMAMIGTLIAIIGAALYAFTEYKEKMKVESTKNQNL